MLILKQAHSNLPFTTYLRALVIEPLLSLLSVESFLSFSSSDASTVTSRFSFKRNEMLITKFNTFKVF